MGPVWQKKRRRKETLLTAQSPRVKGEKRESVTLWKQDVLMITGQGSAFTQLRTGGKMPQGVSVGNEGQGLCAQSAKRNRFSQKRNSEKIKDCFNEDAKKAYAGRSRRGAKTKIRPSVIEHRRAKRSANLGETPGASEWKKRGRQKKRGDRVVPCKYTKSKPGTVSKKKPSKSR